MKIKATTLFTSDGIAPAMARTPQILDAARKRTNRAIHRLLRQVIQYINTPFR
jgi:hypothetical protein